MQINLSFPRASPAVLRCCHAGGLRRTEGGVEGGLTLPGQPGKIGLDEQRPHADRGPNGLFRLQECNPMQRYQKRSASSATGFARVSARVGLGPLVKNRSHGRGLWRWRLEGVHQGQELQRVLGGGTWVGAVEKER
jgi:hypothetical protein